METNMFDMKKKKKKNPLLTRVLTAEQDQTESSNDYPLEKKYSVTGCQVGRRGAEKDG